MGVGRAVGRGLAAIVAVGAMILGGVTAASAASPSGGSISGIVTRADTGKPVKGVSVMVDAGEEKWFDATTDAAGKYTLDQLPAGEYTVAFDPSGAVTGLISQYWKNARDLDSATRVTVTAGHAASGINAVLAVSGAISGKVTRKDNGKAVSGADIIATLVGSDEWYDAHYARTSSNGTYVFDGLSAGKYTLSVSSGYSENGADLASQTTATPVVVAGGKTTTGVDFALAKGGVIAGTVDVQKPVSTARWADITTYQWSGSSWTEYMRSTGWGAYTVPQSEPDGSTFGTLPAGTYTVGFEYPGQCTQFWDSQKSLKEATSLTVSAGKTTTGIDGHLRTSCTTSSVAAGTVSVSGMPRVGESLAAKVGSWGPSPVALAYQWKADGVAVKGATSASWTVTDAVAGKRITVTVTGSRPGYSSVSKTSAATAVVGASFTPPKRSPFKDVSTGSAFYTEVTWLASSGVTTGYADGTFRPGNPVTREAMAAFLYRMAGSPSFTAPKKSPFKDVSTKAAFYKEVTWLAQSGVTTGYADGTFRPGNPITREAMAAFLYRSVGQPSFTVPKKSPFTDVSTKAAFYKEVTWLASTKVTTGYADGTFRPGNQVTREATAAFLYRTTH